MKGVVFVVTIRQNECIIKLKLVPGVTDLCRWVNFDLPKISINLLFVDG